MRYEAILAGALLFPLLLVDHAASQIQIGTIRGTIVDSAGAVVSGATISLSHATSGFKRDTKSDAQGSYIFNNVPFDAYLLTVNTAGYQGLSREISVRSNIPLTLDLQVGVAGVVESVIIQPEGPMVEKDSSSSVTDIDESFIRRLPGAIRPNQQQRLIATAPGWLLEDNGLLHIRGVDDGIVYVVDGIPNISRLDSLSASSFDIEMARTVNVLTGNIPAEFGGRSGAVITIQPHSGVDLPVTGSISAGAGSFRTERIAYDVGGRIGKEFGIFIAGSANRSDRFIDPPDPRNFNNRGGALRLNLRADWHPTANDILLFNVSVNGGDFRVPNRFDQEVAGQRQRQELRDDSQSVSWQRAWSSNSVSNVAYYRRSYRARLFGSEFDTPLFAEQDRKHTHQGVIANGTRVYRGHTIKAGIEVSRVSPREFLRFAITDYEAAEEADISEAALRFDIDNPFVFRDRRIRFLGSWFVQDSFAPFRNLTISAGLRYDRSGLLVSDQQFSPRIGGVYYFPRTETAIRGSFNRLFMPPQVENLLLADSEHARRLSPFESGGRGGAPIKPEKISAYEVGFSQAFFGLFKIDAAYWWRNFRNYDDPNVFFSTTIIFPNSVASGFARGVEVRLDVPERNGWSAHVSYGNSRVLQTGPINGGLFLTDEFIEIGPGTKFIPDHDQRNSIAFGIHYSHRRTGLWTSFSGRHQSGPPLEVEEDELEELMSEIGAELVNFDRGRVKPTTVFDLSVGVDLRKEKRVGLSAQFDVENLFDLKFAYNFGNPFSGTHFGHPRLFGGRIRLLFR